MAITAQNKTEPISSFQTHISRKKIYEIKYNKEHWIASDKTSKWDSEFHDTYNLVNAYFIEFDFFVNEKNLKSTIKSQYEDLGKIKKLTIYTKTINEMEGNYFECELEYNNSIYIFQGFVYNGQGGAMEVQFGVQKEGIKHTQEINNEFCNGIKIIR